MTALDVPIHPGHLGFDIDCVVADTMEAFIRLAAEKHDLVVAPEQITEFAVENCLPIDPAIINAIFRRLLDEPIKHDLQPMPHAVPVLNQLARHAPLTFITARPDRPPIFAWLEYLLGPRIMAEARLVAMGDHNGKADHIKELGISHFIDDRYETCEELTTHGITAIVFTQPWNEKRHNLPQVTNWTDIADLCGLDRPAINQQQPVLATPWIARTAVSP